MELYDKPFVYKEKELNFILNHLKILCGNDDEVYNYFIKWNAQLIQYPEMKTIIPTLISKEGAGKGSYVILMRKKLGNNKVFETTDPARDVWGNHNSIMANAFLVYLNEHEKRSTIEHEGKIKGLITDNSLTINPKGIDQYIIKSHHRFFATTNREEPFKTSTDDRRNYIIRSSDELIGNKKYFEYFYEILNDNDVIKTCYEYFKSIPDVNKFNNLRIPKTEYQENLKKIIKTNT
jgi:hypothetical protein